MLKVRAHPPARAVLATESVSGNGVIEFLLDCGHRTRRRPHICEPKHLLCRDCAA